MSGIIELPADAPVGTRFADYAGLDDPVFDVAVTPNRPGLHGRARHRPRPRGGRASGTLKPLAMPQIEGSVPVPGAGPDRGPDGLPRLLRPRDPRRDAMAPSPNGCSGG